MIDAESIKKTWPGMTVFFDVDGTLVRWQTMHSFFEDMVQQGVFPKVALTMLEESLTGWKNRSLPFRTFLDAMVTIFLQELPGVRVKDAEFIAKKTVEREGDRLNVFPGALLTTAQIVGLQTALISGSPDIVIQALAQALGVDMFLGTEYPEQDGSYINGIPKFWVLDKSLAIKHLAREHALKPEDSIAIGDSENDITMFEIVRWPICFNPNNLLLNKARVKRWPMVIERKNVIVCLKPDASGRLQETDLTSLMPQWLATELRARLETWSST